MFQVSGLQGSERQKRLTAKFTKVRKGREGGNLFRAFWSLENLKQ
jgi:hypothetical protein